MISVELHFPTHCELPGVVQCWWWNAGLGMQVCPIQDDARANKVNQGHLKKILLSLYN